MGNAYREQFEAFLDDERNGIARPDRGKVRGILTDIPRWLSNETRTYWELGKRLHQIEELTSNLVRNRCADQIFGIKKSTQLNYLRVYRNWPEGNLPKRRDGTTCSLTECLIKLGHRKPTGPNSPTGDSPATTYLNVLRGDKWVERKKELETLVLDDGPSRVRTYAKTLEKSDTEQSVFDAYLASILYEFFCPAGGLILDPFAGLPVRGCVAFLGGYRYLGYELDPEQVARNNKQHKWLQFLLDDNDPASNMVGEMTCHVGDAQQLTSPTPVDFIIACPPYLDLERYSKRSNDLSNMSEAEFTAAYDAILARAFSLLKDHRFAAFVVQDVRPRKNNPHRYLFRLVSLTEEIAEKHGARLYNKAPYIAPYGSAPQRMRKPFENSRILTSAHQTVLNFCKGDPKAATAVIDEACAREEEKYERILEEYRVPVAQRGEATVPGALAT